MVVALVLLTVVVFIVVDLLLRMVLKRIDQRRLGEARREALDLALRLDVDEAAGSLLSVEVEKPRARILAVDDEPVVLESFRKILVLDGYSISTVESGEEALGLIQKHDYDFVFTDLKMPGLDGLELTKAVKQIRPDVDVIMITGYGTIDSAVGAMKYGAMDYVEKPFTEDELTGFVGKALIRRQARLEREQPPRLQIVTSTEPQADSARVFNVPAGVYLSPAHAWVRLEMTGDARVGMDDFTRKTIGNIEELRMPRVGASVRRGETLFTARHGTHRATIPSPLTGEVVAVNVDLSEQLELLTANPYEAGWICRITPSNLAAELAGLRIGSDAVDWFRDEIDKLVAIEKGLGGAGADKTSDDLWEKFSSTFLHA